MRQSFFRFGIPSVDGLLGGPAPSAMYDPKADAPLPGFSISDDPSKDGIRESICVTLMGGDGTGKSLLALHSASRWLFDSRGQSLVIFASTDLSSERARRAWHDFALGHPDRIDDVFLNTRRSDKKAPIARIADMPPYEESRLFVSERRSGDVTEHIPHVDFLDLRAHSRGDNWSYLNNMVAALPPAANDAPLHLLILDGVDGMEASSGNLDAFGSPRDRRSRIAQLLRTSRGRCHVLLTVGEHPNESADDERPSSAEAHLADLVIRLKYDFVHNYERRTLTVSKARGQGHRRGSHPYFIRTGRRSTTGYDQNPDDPYIEHPTGEGTQAYVFVVPSLHLRSRELMLKEDEPIELSRHHYLGFGCKYLDSLLGERRLDARESDRESKGGGFEAQTPVALIGEDGTFKSKLSKSFLAEAFSDPANYSCNTAVILITTKIIDKHGLIRRLVDRLVHPEAVEDFMRRVIVRRLEVHFIDPALFLHIIEQCIREAQRVALGEDAAGIESRRRSQGFRIRLVLDNWTLIQETYPELTADKRLLPALLMMLRREGIGTLIIANEDPGFSHDLRLRQSQTLRDLTSLHVYTWRVPFHGQARIAITVVPPRSPDHLMTIREMRLRDRGEGVPEVNPEFELFEGLEVGQPKFVRLNLQVFHAPAIRGHRRSTHSPYWSQLEDISLELLDRSSFSLRLNSTREQYAIMKDRNCSGNRTPLPPPS